MDTRRMSQFMSVVATLVAVMVVAAVYGTSVAAPAPPRTPTPAVQAAACPAAEANSIPSFSDRFDVGGYSLFMQCLGSGQPTVILDSGAGWASDEWANIVPALANTTRVCVYDRAGLGRSDAAPQPRTSQEMAGDLHRLLLAAHIDGPYVLAGHNIGADTMRLYYQSWPAEVAAMVMLGAVPPDYTTRQTSAMPSTLGA